MERIGHEALAESADFAGANSAYAKKYLRYEG